MKSWIGLLARLLVGVVWIIAGLAKLPDPAGSVRAVRAYQLLPEAIVPTVGHLLPIVEIVIGIFLVLGLLTRPFAVLAAVLFVAFITGISSAWIRGLEINCGCFGGSGVPLDVHRQYAIDLARDALLLAGSVWLIVRPRTRPALDNLLFPSSSERLADGAEQATVQVWACPGADAGAEAQGAGPQPVRDRRDRRRGAADRGRWLLHLQ